MNISSRKKNGFTLIEILLVVGFIALASISTYVIYNKVKTTQYANVESRNIMALKAGIKNLYAGSAIYNGLTSAVLINGKVAPENMVDPTGTKIINSLGQEVVIQPALLNKGLTGGNQFFNATNGGHDGFAIIYPSIDNDSCTKLLVASQSAFEIISVSNFVIKNTYQNINFDLANAAYYCGRWYINGTIMLISS